MIYFCLFVWAFRPTHEFFTHYWLRAANFYLCLALMAIEQWGFFSVPHLLWHGATVYNGNLWGRVTHTPIAERSAMVLSTCFYDLSLTHSMDSNTQPSACVANALTHCATAASTSPRNIWNSLLTKRKSYIYGEQKFIVLKCSWNMHYWCAEKKIQYFESNSFELILDLKGERGFQNNFFPAWTLN